MRTFVPPLFLLLAIALAVAAVALLSVDPPRASMDLHRARALGDEAQEELLEAHLSQRTHYHSILIFSLFSGSALCVVIAFLSMDSRDDSPSRN